VKLIYKISYDNLTIQSKTQRQATTWYEADTVQLLSGNVIILAVTKKPRYTQHQVSKISTRSAETASRKR